MDLDAQLNHLDRLIASAAPTFHKRMQPGASDQAIEGLRAEAGTLPEDVVTWFRWHAGAGDGFLPDTSWGIPTIDEVIAEIRFVRAERRPSDLAPHVFAPIMTGRDGQFIYYVQDSDGTRSIWKYDRGERVETISFEAWLPRLIERWRAEGAILRVAWVRRQRSPMGWQELHLPARARAKLRERIAQLPLKIEAGARKDGWSDVRIDEGPTPSWQENAEGTGDQLVITLTTEGARELAAALADKKMETVRLPGLDDWRLCLLDR
jgi:hypothetical protein